MNSNERHESPLPSTTERAAIWNEVQTARLVLRRLRSEDDPAMFAFHGDAETNLSHPSDPHPDLATSEEMLRSCLHHWETSGFGYWAVALAQNAEQIIGIGGVEHQVWREREVLNLSYRFTPAAWGQGYATELVLMAVIFARTTLPPWPIVARIRASNIPAIRTAERAKLLRRPDLETEQVVFALDWPSPAEQGQ